MSIVRLTVSVVIYKHGVSELSALIESYAKSLAYAQKNIELKSTFYIVNNDTASALQNTVEDLCQKNEINYQYVKSDKNGGYGYGNNLIIKQVASDYHLICNPDIIFYQDTLLQAVDYMKSHQDVVLLSSAVYDLTGQRQFLCRKNPKFLHLFLRRFVAENIKNIFFRKYLDKFEYRDFSYDEVIENVPCLTGCFMFFRTEILQQLNGFDERFFYYMDDADLSRRALEYGKTAYIPDVKVAHAWHRGAYKSKKLRNIAIKSSLKYFCKWGGIL